MPYLAEKERKQLDEQGFPPSVGGELNYEITKLFVQYVQTNGLRYESINALLGAGLGAILEFYVRVAIPYENAKALENGDIYGPILHMMLDQGIELGV